MILSHVSENLIIWNVYSLFLYVVFLVLKKKLPCLLCQDFPGGSEVKNPPAMQETWVQSLNWGDPLEKGMATTPVLLLGEPTDRGAWRAQSMGSKRVRHDWATNTFTFTSSCACLFKIEYSILAWRIPWTV